MDGSEDLVQPQAVAHGQHVFGQQITGVYAHDGAAQYLVFSRHGEHLHEAVGFAVGNGPVQVIQGVFHHLIGNAFLFRLLLVEPNPGDFGVDERGPRNHRIIGLELLEGAKERVYRRVPGLVRRRVGELERPRHIACGQDVGVNGFQVLVGGHCAVGRYAQLLQPIARKAGHTAHRAQQRVKLDADLLALVFHNDRFGAVA